MKCSISRVTQNKAAGMGFYLPTAGDVFDINMNF